MSKALREQMIAIRFTRDEMKIVRRLAREDGCGVGQLVRDLIERERKRRERKTMSVPTSPSREAAA